MSCVELQGIFLDLYNDSVDSDETREYQHFPFCKRTDIAESHF